MRRQALHHRASDPGLRLGQLGRVTWVHCPECDGPARHTRMGVRCLACGYMTVPVLRALSYRWATIGLTDPRCVHCRLPLPNPVRPTAREHGGKLLVRVKCPHCAKTVDYPGRLAFPPEPQASAMPRMLALFLTVQVGGNTLWVDNLAHLDALENYLGARVRERGPVRGKTMMTMLPAWMKSAANRPKIIRGLRLLREKAERAGITE